MVSGIGPKDHLSELDIPVVHDAPGVGMNLQDHVAIGGIAYLVEKPMNNTDLNFSFNLPRTVNAQALRLFAREDNGPIYTETVAEGMAFVNSK